MLFILPNSLLFYFILTFLFFILLFFKPLFQFFILFILPFKYFFNHLINRLSYKYVLLLNFQLILINFIYFLRIFSRNIQYLFDSFVVPLKPTTGVACREELFRWWQSSWTLCQLFISRRIFCHILHMEIFFLWIKGY